MAQCEAREKTRRIGTGDTGILRFAGRQPPISARPLGGDRTEGPRSHVGLSRRVVGSAHGSS